MRLLGDGCVLTVGRCGDGTVVPILDGMKNDKIIRLLLTIERNRKSGSHVRDLIV